MIILDVFFYIFCLVVAIQIIYYLLVFGKFAFSKSKKHSQKNIAVSVIICAKNEAENLEKFLPDIINQDYPEFEIVLINDMSNDNTLDVMESFNEDHQNIKVVNVKTHDAFWGNKKYALTLGIKAAKNNFLLFTDADCKPISNQWIREMSSHFSNTKTIVLGYGAHTKIKSSLLNKLIRYETLLTAIQYFSYAKIGLPYMGVGRNLAYTKEAFFVANGFMNHMNVRSGDDDLFINQIATKHNTSICFSEESVTTSIPEISFKKWYRQKRRHITTANHYKPIHKIVLALFYITQFLFWSVGIILLAFLFNWKIVVSLFILRIVLQLLIIVFSAKKLNEKGLILLSLFLEPFLIIIQMVIFINNLVSKPNYWK